MIKYFYQIVYQIVVRNNKKYFFLNLYLSFKDFYRNIIMKTIPLFLFSKCFNLHNWFFWSTIKFSVCLWIYLVSCSLVRSFFIQICLAYIIKWMSLNYTKQVMQICKSFSRASYISVSGGAFPPEFAAPISNLTVALGRDATFTCLVKHLGGYRVSFPLWKFINRWCMKFLQR